VNTENFVASLTAALDEWPGLKEMISEVTTSDHQTTVGGGGVVGRTPDI
jgi:hypothetical protein